MQAFWTKIRFFKNGPTPASFSFIFVFSNQFYNKYICEKMSIQYRYGSGIRNHNLRNMSLLP